MSCIDQRAARSKKDGKKLSKREEYFFPTD